MPIPDAIRPSGSQQMDEAGFTGEEVIDNVQDRIDWLDGNKADDAATTAALATKADLVGGTVPTAQLPAIAVTDYLGIAANEAAMLALVGQKGDWCTRSDTGAVWVITGSDPSILAGWTSLTYPASPVSSVNGHTGVVVLGAADVGALGATASATGDLTGNYPNPSIAARAVTWAKTQAIATARILGRKTAGSGDVEELTGDDVRDMLPTFGAGARGLVPAAGGTPDATKFLNEAGAFTVPSGGSGHTIEDEGTPLTNRAALNFAGTGVTVTDDSGNDATVVTIPGSGAALLSLKNVKDYGAEGDARVAWGSTSGTTLTATGSYWDASPFTPDDVGKEVHIEHGTTTGDRWLRTTITGYTSPTVVTIADAAVTGSNLVFVVGTNDTAAIDAAIAACADGEKIAFPQGWYLTDGGHEFGAYQGAQGADRESSILVTTKTDAGYVFRADGIGVVVKDLELMYAGFTTQNYGGNRDGGAGKPIRSLRKGILTNRSDWLAFTGLRLRLRGFDIAVHHADGPLFELRDIEFGHNWTNSILLECPTWPDYSLRRIDGVRTEQGPVIFGGRAGVTDIRWREGGSTHISNSLLQGNDVGIHLEARGSTQEVRLVNIGFEDSIQRSIKGTIASGHTLRDTVISGCTFSQLVDQTMIEFDGNGDYRFKGLSIVGCAAQAQSLGANTPFIKLTYVEESAVTGCAPCNTDSTFRKPIELVNCRDIRHDFLYSAKLYRSTNQTWTTAGNVDLLWDIDQHDFAGLHSTSSNTDRFTTIMPGKYRITAQLHITSSGTLSYAIARAMKNESTTEDSANMLGSAFAGPIPGFQTGVFLLDTGVVELAAGDRVRCWVSTNGSGTATLNKDWSWFSIEQVA